MRMNTCVIAAVMLCLTGSAWSITKCTGADGKVVFQDLPCAGKAEAVTVRPARGADAPAVPANTSAAVPDTRQPKPKEGAFGETWQRRTYLENQGVSSARSALEAHQRRCIAQQQELAGRKRLANNNLAGATWEQSISTEMQAAATACDSRSRELRSDLESLERELRELQNRK